MKRLYFQQFILVIISTMPNMTVWVKKWNYNYDFQFNQRLIWINKKLKTNTNTVIYNHVVSIIFFNCPENLALKKDCQP